VCSPFGFGLFYNLSLEMIGMFDKMWLERLEWLECFLATSSVVSLVLFYVHTATTDPPFTPFATNSCKFLQHGKMATNS
jgi:hypothetical protein